MRVLLSLLLFAGIAGVERARAQDAQKPAAPSSGPLSGRWTLTVDFNGTPAYFNLTLQQQGEKLTGDLGGDKLEGTVSGTRVEFLAKDERGGTEDVKGTAKDGTISGTLTFATSDDPTHRETHPFTAARVPARSTAAAERHEFVPTVFYGSSRRKTSRC